jgi:hypothetical protein
LIARVRRMFKGPVATILTGGGIGRLGARLFADPDPADAVAILERVEV